MPEVVTESEVSMGSQEPEISVVIPSVGRELLKAAVQSVRNQGTSVNVQLIVVFDLDEADVPTAAASAAAEADVVLYTGGGRRGCHARNLGVLAAKAPWVAFLDDDDSWMPHKLSKQLAMAKALQLQGKRPIIGSRVALRANGAVDPSVTGVPQSLIRDSDSVEDYLFKRRRPGARRASFFTSSILADRSLCTAVPWNESLSRHQDWDWLVRAGRVDGTVFAQVPEDLVLYNLGSAGSISAAPDWQSSLSWANSVLRGHSKRVFVDFLAAQPLRYAFQGRDYSGVLRVLLSIAASGRFPSFGPALIGLAGLIPRRNIQWLMTKIK